MPPPSSLFFLELATATVPPPTSLFFLELATATVAPPTSIFFLELAAATVAPPTSIFFLELATTPVPPPSLPPLFFFSLFSRGVCPTPSGPLVGMDGFVWLRAVSRSAALSPPPRPRFDLPGPSETSLVSPGDPPWGSTFVSFSTRPSFDLVFTRSSAARSVADGGDASSNSTTPASSAILAILGVRSAPLASSFILARSTSTSRGNHVGAPTRKPSAPSISSPSVGGRATIAVRTMAATGPHTGASSGSTAHPTCSRPYSVGRRM